MKNLILTILLIAAFQSACLGAASGIELIAERCNQIVNTPIDLAITPDIIDVKLDLKNSQVKITVVESDMKAYAPVVVVASNTVKFDWTSQF
jgi:hypothetical protein